MVASLLEHETVETEEVARDHERQAVPAVSAAKSVRRHADRRQDDRACGPGARNAKRLPPNISPEPA